MDKIEIRNGRPSDHRKVIAVMPDWWGGRDLTSSLPKILFIHFSNTIYIAENNDQLIGFLVGFLSQSYGNVGYIHFVGVNPDYRKHGIGRLLYQKFYDASTRNGRTIVKCCTSPVNKLSIVFHQRMGFTIEDGDEIVDGIPVTMNFLRENAPMVLFKKELATR